MSMLLSFDCCSIVMKELMRFRNSLRWSFDVWLASRLSKVVRSLTCTMLAFEFVFSITNKCWYSKSSSFENERYSSRFAKVCSICVSIFCSFETSSIFESLIDIFFAKNLRDCAKLVEEFDLWMLDWEDIAKDFDLWDVNLFCIADCFVSWERDFLEIVEGFDSWEANLIDVDEIFHNWFTIVKRLTFLLCIILVFLNTLDIDWAIYRWLLRLWWRICCRFIECDETLICLSLATSLIVSRDNIDQFISKALFLHSWPMRRRRQKIVTIVRSIVRLRLELCLLCEHFEALLLLNRRLLRNWLSLTLHIEHCVVSSLKRSVNANEEDEYMIWEFRMSFYAITLWANYLEFQQVVVTHKFMHCSHFNYSQLFHKFFVKVHK